MWGRKGLQLQISTTLYSSHNIDKKTKGMEDPTKGIIEDIESSDGSGPGLLFTTFKNNINYFNPNLIVFSRQLKDSTCP